MERVVFHEQRIHPSLHHGCAWQCRVGQIKLHCSEVVWFLSLLWCCFYLRPFKKCKGISLIWIVNGSGAVFKHICYKILVLLFTSFFQGVQRKFHRFINPVTVVQHQKFWEVIQEGVTHPLSCARQSVNLLLKYFLCCKTLLIILKILGYLNRYQKSIHPQIVFGFWPVLDLIASIAWMQCGFL